MALKLDKGKVLLIETIRTDKRHRDYKRVTELAEEYTAYVTGEDAEKLLIQFNPREDAVAFAQRVSITVMITGYMAARLMTPMYKAARTLASKTMSWSETEKADENKKKLNDAISHYYGEMSVDDYLGYRMVELDSTDPNSFIVTDFEGEVDPANPKTLADPYPFEVNSEEAIDFKYRNNILQYLTVLNCINDLKKYTIYLEDNAIIAQQITEDQYNERESDVEILFKDPEKKEKDEIYSITTVPLKAGKIPAIRVGTKKDIKTRNRTCVPLMHAARAFFKKSIKTVSELDLTIALHTFPQKWQYDTPCPGDLKDNVICIGGKTPGGDVCKFCNGSGWNEHRSAQDIIRVPMPDKLSEVVSLGDFSHYNYPPPEILNFLKNLGLYEFTELAIKALYNSETYTTDTVAKTATETNYDFESVYDALKPFTDQWSNVQKHIVTVIAAYLSISKGLTVDHKFPKDFKMKPVAQLMEDLSKANTSGAPSFVKKEIVRDITQKLYVDKPEEVLKLDVKEKFFPFNGKTESEIVMAITDNLVRKFHKVLYANFDMIFDELEQENTTDIVSFYKMDVKAQRALLEKKVNEYILAIDNEQAASRATGFGPPSDSVASDEDSQDYDAGTPVMHGADKVEIISANAGPDGGTYTIKLPDGTEKEVSGKDLKAA